MSLVDDILGQVFFFLDICDPPFGCANLLGGKVVVGELEEITLRVVARISLKLGKSSRGGGNLREEALSGSETVVVGCGQVRNNCVGVLLEELRPVGLTFAFFTAVLIEEEIVLQDHVHSDTGSEEAAVVAVVHRGDILDRVVLEIESADLDGVRRVDVEHRADSVVDRVVQESEPVDLGGLPDVDGISAASEDRIHVT